MAVRPHRWFQGGSRFYDSEITTPAIPGFSMTEGPASKFLHDILDKLVEFKALPKYQFERRVDIFLVPFLPRILEKTLKVEGPIELVVPEFPLKRDDDYMSRNADYLLYDGTQGKERWILFELKTDSEYENPKQIARYREAKKSCMPKLIEDVRCIRRSKSDHDRRTCQKYDKLLELLDKYKDHYDHPIHIVYLSPKPLDDELEGPDEHSVTFQSLLDLDFKGEVWKVIRDTIVRVCVDG